MNKNIDFDQLKLDMDNLRITLSNSQTSADYKHMKKFYYITWNRPSIQGLEYNK